MVLGLKKNQKPDVLEQFKKLLPAESSNAYHFAWGYFFYHKVGDKFETGRLDTVGCYGPIGSRYTTYCQSKGETVRDKPLDKTKVGIVCRNHAHALHKYNSNMHAYAPSASMWLIEALTSPTYKGRWKPYIDSAAKEFGMSLTELAAFMYQVGLPISTEMFANRSKLEVMSFMMFFREFYNGGSYANNYARIVDASCMEEWIVCLLMSYNMTCDNRIMHVGRGHGTFHPLHTPKEVMDFIYGEGEIEANYRTMTAKPFSESNFWSNSGSHVYRYIGNIDKRESPWQEILAPVKEYQGRRGPKTPTSTGIAPEYLRALYSRTDQGLTPKALEYKQAFKETLKGVVKKCVESLA